MVAKGFCPSSEGWGPLSPYRPVDLTPCFETGVLAAALNAAFIVLALFRLKALSTTPKFPSSVVSTFGYWVKLSVATAAAFSSLAELVLWASIYPYSNAFTVSLTIQTIAAAVAAQLHHREQFANRIGSTHLLLFWLFTVVTSGIRLRTFVALGLAQKDLPAIVALVAYLVLALAALVLESQPKPAALYEFLEDEDEYSEYDPNCPEEKANIFSRIMFTWMTPLLVKGYKKPLQASDLYDLAYDYRPAVAADRFERNWSDELRSGSPSLFRVIMRTYGLEIFLGGFYKLIKDIVALFQPILLSRLIGFVSSYNTPDAEPVENGYFYAVSMFVVATVQTVAFQQHWVQNQRVNCLLKTSFTTAIYRKSLVLSNDTRQKFTVGEIVNHMSVDGQRVSDFLSIAHQLWSSPLQIIMAVILLYRTLGWCVFAGVFAMVISVPTGARLSRSMRALNKKLMGYRDQRMKIMDEVLSGIKIIKLYAWEPAFTQKINHIRNDLELGTIKKYGFYNASFSFIITLVPFVVSFSTFGLYSIADGKSHGPLTPQLVFVALTLFNMLKFPLSHGPMFIPALLECMVSHRRIYDFLTSENIDITAIDRSEYDRNSPDTSKGDVLVGVEKGMFKWASGEQPTLHDINLKCTRDELLAVIGKVGSGKSSLISAILGDMIKVSGTVSLRGKVAYVPQQAWIMNATLRENILFGHKYDPEFYEKVVDACALRQDLEMLPGGDFTEIGEKGINLSGGQKARVSLARAVYARADVYLLDDPLAAVDSHVGKHIFTQVLGPNGMLRSRARILVTNAVQYLASVDRVVMLKSGKIVDQGTFQQVTDAKSEIYEFSHRYIDNNTGSMTPVGNSSLNLYSEDEVTTNELDGSVLPLGIGIHKQSTKQTLGRASVGTVHESIHNRRRAKSADQPEPAGSNAQGAIITTEHSEQGKVEWEIYKTYFKACGIRNILLFGVAILSASLSNVSANLWLKHWASSNVDTRQNAAVAFLQRHSVAYYLLIYGGFGVLGATMSAIQSLVLWTICSIRASKRTHAAMLRGVLRSPMAFFDTTPLGRILNRFSSDQQRIDEALPRSVSGLVSTMVGVISAVSVIALATPLMLVMMVPLAFAYRYLQQHFLFTSRELRRLDSVSKSPIFAHFQETLGGVTTIRAYAQGERFVGENENRLDQNIRAYYTYLSANRWLSIRLETLGNLVMFGTSLLAVIALHYFGVGDAGLVGLSVTYALDFTSALNWSVRSYTEIENSMVQLERVTEYSKLPSEAPEIIEDRRPHDSWPDYGVVEFKNYSTRYRKGLDLVIKDASFRVMPSQKVGIVGRTGAGKSSLTLALFRLIEPANGEILIDGEDISKYGLFDLRSRLSIIPQDPVLFAGTVRENLDPFGNYDDAKIWRALEQASLADTIKEKDGKLDHVVSQAGENFSVGQRQLICLARALLKQAKVLVLDEATAAIDNLTDSVIQETIRTEFKHCTVLTIAHRLDTIIDNDMILVVDSGKVAEFDTPESLLNNRESLFSKLVEESKNTAV